MAYPPTPPPATRTDATALTTNHPDDHNDISTALTDIINELGADPKGSYASVTARLDASDDPAFVSHPTVVVDQGANFGIANTVAYSEYTKVGKRVTWTFDIGMTAAGATGVVVVYAPFAAAHTSAWLGSGYIWDASDGRRYNGVWGSHNGSTDYVAFRVTGLYPNPWGSTPLINLAAGDELHGTISYKSAT